MIITPAPAKQLMTTMNVGTLGKTTEIFKVGQILDVVTYGKSQGGKISLRIGDINIDASTTIPLKENAHLLLKVEQLAPSLLLKPIQAPIHDVKNQVLKDAIVQLLPKQASLLPLLSLLSQKQNIFHDSRNAPKIANIIMQILEVLPERKTLIESKGLKQAVSQSGVFAEANSKKSVENHSSKPDLKVQLLKLLKLISPAKSSHKTSTALIKSGTSDIKMNGDVPPPLRGSLPSHQASIKLAARQQQLLGNELATLVSKVQGALARIVLLQAATSENINEGQLLWQIEIPIKHNNAIEHIAINIEKENKGDDDTETSWVINLALDLPNLGDINLHVVINNKNVSATFWSESEDTLKTIEQNLDQLRSSLSDRGLDVTAIKCQKGAPAATISKPSASIIDYKI